jgi:CheY-like chemotaxis protein
VLPDPEPATHDSLEFTVQDTGIGIDELHMRRLFKPFSQVDSSISRKFGGTGLGLAISKQIILAMGGDIEVESIVGEGTTFTFAVRSEKQPAQEPYVVIEAVSVINAHLEQEEQDEWKRLKLLLVEDNKVNQQMAVRMLKKLGLTTDVANDGFEGVDKVTQGLYDVIFMDVSMPGMSGLEATARIRCKCPEQYKKPPFIVAMTANALDSDRQLCLDSGMDDFMSKPFDLTDLKEALRHACRYHFGADCEIAAESVQP